MSAPTAAAVALSPPRVTRRWTSLYALAWLGLWTAWLVPVQLALPEQLDAIDHLHRYRDFGVVNGIAGVVTLLALPLFGAACDRTRTPFGRRRAWVAGGALVYAGGLALTGYQHDWRALAACWGLVAVGQCAMTTGLTAVVADAVPDEQRGVVSGAMFGPQGVGLVLGILVVSGLGAVGRYWLLAALLLVLTAPWLLLHRDREGRAPALRVREVVASLWVDPRTHPDFAWAFGSRLLVNVGNALGTTYLYFFLKDDLRVADPDATLLLLTLVYLVATLSATAVGGVWSDRTGRRKVFVAVAAVLQGVAALLLAALPSVATAMVGGALLGAGYGAFLAVDQALVTAVLPNAEDRAKDLGILGIGTNLPQAVGPLLAAALVAGAGFGTLFAAAGLTTLVGAVMVQRVRSVR